MGVTVVGQQEFDRRVRHPQLERSFDHIDDFWFARGHVQSVGEAALQLLATCLGQPLDGLLVGGSARSRELPR